MTAPALTLPVQITVGDYTVEVGTLTLAAGEQVGQSLAALFRQIAEAYEATVEEVTGDGTA
ncbi:hypothetical protein [Streptomyces sp. Isolate_219]|uniref:hypothetical protein n=1 Tax=Streptomyces sp. Isolate_219 TaxID=2950110 RepID=UPI0021C8482A|nr:hypothetical protein [Streptomyces sp. Isolate_219]MCR8576171.1 hypothetical protein [Streptomyces sp. Isolate_219]